MWLRFFLQTNKLFLFSSKKRQLGDRLPERDLLEAERPQEEVEGLIHKSIDFIKISIFIQVSFVGEPGLDMGGLTKEWFQLLIKQIFDAEYGMFVYHTHSRYKRKFVWNIFSPFSIYSQLLLVQYDSGGKSEVR